MPFRFQVKRKAPLWFLMVGFIVIAVGFWLYQTGLVINITGSMPRGIYWSQSGPIQRGDLVTFCLHEKDEALAIERHYLIHGSRCQLSEPLIKKVIAVPGDRVVLTADFIAVNGRVLHYKTLDKDSHGRPLTAYPAGNYVNTNDYWVIGTGSDKSWDSRYFGPIQKKDILWKIRPVLVYSEKRSSASIMKQCTLTFNHNITLYDVPLAETLAQQKKGLSGKDASHGMFFVFNHPRRVGFWMKDTSTPLSIGFFDASGKLISIEDMTPNTEKLYFSAGDAKYALELTKGNFEKIGLLTGTRLIKQSCYAI